MEDFQTVRSINLVSSTRRERVPEEMSQRLEETKE
jgi:hypothetical protein